MAADLFETYAVTMVATMVLAAISFGPEARVAAMLFPLAIGAVCVATSIAGTYFVKLPANNSIMGDAGDFSVRQHGGYFLFHAPRIGQPALADGGESLIVPFIVAFDEMVDETRQHDFGRH